MKRDNLLLILKKDKKIQCIRSKSNLALIPLLMVQNTMLSLGVETPVMVRTMIKKPTLPASEESAIPSPLGWQFDGNKLDLWK
jgi:hypothetical protein